MVRSLPTIFKHHTSTQEEEDSKDLVRRKLILCGDLRSRAQTYEEVSHTSTPPPQIEGKEEPLAKENSQPKPDYETMDITYECRDPQVDAVRPRRRNPIPGILEGYHVTLDSAPSNSDTSEDYSDLLRLKERSLHLEA
jgi:hypothetical protein